MHGYLFLDIICSSKLTVFLELRSRKTVRFSEQIISAKTINAYYREISSNFSQLGLPPRRISIRQYSALFRRIYVNCTFLVCGWVFDARHVLYFNGKITGGKSGKYMAVLNRLFA